ncbi:sigma-70 family RNA polymerase sigma factor [Paenibacillus oralis]|uniref:Sigma-70 family RNA polymerase sigma factor n=1 Tax=Paenibacillus oralis TaxID=2490856 RepID=A0A3P3UA59_9BACL|nr:sigma-70 family RNA polymerase sigma factor [Paenibacillus oralis]RRJ67252.1 sigma-70 family RNA polymerase sigma factor [Paenibacillus oralis]
MCSESRTCEAVEKGFSIYIKLCIRHVSRDYFRKLNRDSFYVRPLDAIVYEPYLTLNLQTSTVMTVEDFEVLSQAIETLSSSEKKVLYLKFFQNKTDKEIAQFIGVTRQAVSKSKTNVLVKLKSQLEIYL